MDNTGKGAVLCIWGILQAEKAVGRECHKDQDAIFQKELDKSIYKIDRFIMKNSNISKAGLRDRQTKGLEELHALGNICIGDGENMYKLGLRRGAAALHASTVDLLSIPREPVMAPCL